MALKTPSSPNANRRGLSAGDIALQSARAALQAGRPLEAEYLAADVLKANAGSLPAMQILGTALLMQGRGKEAIAPLERAARQSRDAETETWLAIALRQSGGEEEARERLERAVKRKPPFAPAFLELAKLLAQRNREHEAIDILEQGLVAAPGAADLALQLANLHASLGKEAEARAAVMRALAIAPGHPDALFAFARTLQAERDFAQAEAAYVRVLAVRPGDPAARIGLGICLMELGRSEEAFTYLQQVSRVDARMFGEALTALADAGRGRFWLRPSDAARALRERKT